MKCEEQPQDNTVQPACLSYDTKPPDKSLRPECLSYDSKPPDNVVRPECLSYDTKPPDKSLRPECLSYDTKPPDKSLRPECLSYDSKPPDNVVRPECLSYDSKPPDNVVRPECLLYDSKPALGEMILAASELAMRVNMNCEVSSGVGPRLWVVDENGQLKMVKTEVMATETLVQPIGGGSEKLPFRNETFGRNMSGTSNVLTPNGCV